MKIIPFKNYVQVFLLFVFTFLGCLVLSNIYKDKKAYEREHEHIQSFLSNVRYDELSNYLTENHDGYIYIAPSSDLSLESFERAFKEFIIKEDLGRDFVYLDSKSFDDAAYKTIESNFSEDLKRLNISIPPCPNLLVIKGGKIVDILYKTESSITLGGVQSFISEHQVET